MIDPADITPTVEQVAQHIRTRTLDANNVEQGTFTEDTRPTATAAAAAATRSARFVALKLGLPGTEWDGDLLAAATDVAALFAALSIEESFYSDGSAPDDTGSDQLGRMAREQLDALVDTARNNQVGGWRFASIRQVTRILEDEETAP